MLILLLVISIAILVVGTIRYMKVGKFNTDCGWDNFKEGQLLQIFGVICIVITTIAITVIMILIQTAPTVRAADTTDKYIYIIKTLTCKLLAVRVFCVFIKNYPFSLP